MKLLREEADLFFELMFALQSYVNRRLKIIKVAPTVEAYIELSQAEKFKVREALYEHPGLIDDYASEDPDELGDEKLSIIRSWKGFIRGDFYVERYLKKYTLFIDDDKVYGVLGLYDAIDDIIPKAYLPAYIKSVLLPFKGKVIYDGLFQSYNIYLGGGIKRELKETYMRAKQNERIIVSLGELVPKRNEKREKDAQGEIDWTDEIEQLMSVSKRLKGGSAQPAINSPVFSLLKACAELANKAVLNDADVDTLLKELAKVKRAVSKTENTLYRFDR